MRSRDSILFALGTVAVAAVAAVLYRRNAPQREWLARHKALLSQDDTLPIEDETPHSSIVYELQQYRGDLNDR